MIIMKTCNNSNKHGMYNKSLHWCWIKQSGSAMQQWWYITVNQIKKLYNYYYIITVIKINKG